MNYEVTQQPVVSVILPFYRGSAFVAQAIESVLAQTYPAAEIIVVDDGSPEPATAALSQFLDRIRIVRQENKGVAAARNRGIRESSGGLIALIDQDDLWHPTKLERQVAALNGHSEIAVVHSAVSFLDDSTGLQFSKPGSRAFELTGRCYERLFLGSAITCCTIVMRRECFEAVGPFDETLLGTDDYDLMLRLARRYEVLFLPEALATYRLHADNFSKRQLTLLENELKVLDKTLKDDPGLVNSMDRSFVEARLRDACFCIGYRHFTAGTFPAARHYLIRSLRYGVRAYPLVLALASFLPSPLVRRARGAKHSLLARRNRASVSSADSASAATANSIDAR